MANEVGLRLYGERALCHLDRGGIGQHALHHTARQHLHRIGVLVNTDKQPTHITAPVKLEVRDDSNKQSKVDKGRARIMRTRLRPLAWHRTVVPHSAAASPRDLPWPRLVASPRRCAARAPQPETTKENNSTRHGWSQTVCRAESEVSIQTARTHLRLEASSRLLRVS